MKRRNFVKSAILSGVGLACSPWLVNANTNQYEGPILITLQADGGWDTTMHLDPKVNQPNELEITHWSNSAEVQKNGIFSFAPLINNEHFIEKFKNHLLVINGVDTQTNSHSTGILHSLSGKNTTGFPSLPSLFASIKAPDLPFSVLSFGGYNQGSGLILPTRISSGHLIRDMLLKGRHSKNHPYKLAQETDIISQANEKQRLLMAQSNMLPRFSKAMNNFQKSERLSPFLEPFLDTIDNVNSFAQGDSARPQMFLLACKAGVCSAADFHLGGFDTHQYNDDQQLNLLANLNNTVEFIWDYAEELGLAERLTVVITSDFSRTPHYNSANGKDHWPINSYLVMQKNAPWANRVVGATDEFQNPIAINPSSLQPDSSSSGVILNPSHIHNEIRKLLGLSGQSNELRFPFLTTENVEIFSEINSTNV